MPAKYVIHTVGPIGLQPDLLKNAYINSLNLAIGNKCRSIAFPCISTGVYGIKLNLHLKSEITNILNILKGYPNESAAQLVAKTVREFLEGNHENVNHLILTCNLEFLQNLIN